MKQIADLHIHSRFSMATSKDGTMEMLDLWARKKGITLIGTGDMTHPLWRQELKRKADSGGAGPLSAERGVCSPRSLAVSGKRPQICVVRRNQFYL